MAYRAVTPNDITPMKLNLSSWLVDPDGNPTTATNVNAVSVPGEPSQLPQDAFTAPTDMNVLVANNTGNAVYFATAGGTGGQVYTLLFEVQTAAGNTAYRGYPLFCSNVVIFQVAQ